MKNLILGLLCGLVLILTFSGNSADAAAVFELQLANPGMSIFRVRNISTDLEQLTSLSVNIGDIAWNFDIVDGFTALEDSGDLLSPALVMGDGEQDLVRVDELKIDFSGFEAKDRFQFKVDIDSDTGAQNVPSDFRNVYWNNGDADNATITLSYMDKNAQHDSLEFTFSDTDVTEEVYNFTIPEPSSISLLAIGVLALIKRRNHIK